VRSLQRTLTVHLVLGLTAVLLVAEGGLFLFLRHQITSSFDERLVETARLLSSAVHLEPDGKLDLELGEVPIPEFGARVLTGAFEIWDTGVPLYRSASLGGGDLALPPVPASGRAVVDAPLPDGRPGRAVAFPFAPTPEPGLEPGSIQLTLMVVRERGTLDARLLGTSLALVALGLVLLLVMPLVVARVVRRGLSTLLSLGRDVDAIDLKALDRRLPTAGLPTELAPLAKRMNQLLDRVQEGVLRERRFSDDVAHQLRTPIAELRTLAEVSLSGLDPRDAPYRRPFEDAREIAIQMERLAAGLLAIARGPSDHSPVNSSVDLAALARRAGDDLARRVAGRDINLSRQDDRQQIDALAEQGMMESVVASLVDNAVAYTPAGGEIAIATHTDGSIARLTLTNTDRTLSNGDLARLFERFWRKDHAWHDGEHSGLGLAVARAMTEAMGGRLNADRPRPDLIRFTVSVQARR
jgi:signal transduction histidine kinase